MTNSFRKNYKLIALPSIVTLILYIAYFLYIFFVVVFLHDTTFKLDASINPRDISFYTGVFFPLNLALVYAIAMKPVSLTITKGRTYMESRIFSKILVSAISIIVLFSLYFSYIFALVSIPIYITNKHENRLNPVPPICC